MATEELFWVWVGLTLLTFFAVILSHTRKPVTAIAGALGLELAQLCLTYGGLSAIPYTQLPWLQYLNWLLVSTWCLFALLAHLRPGKNRASDIPLYATFAAAGLLFLTNLFAARGLMRLTLLASLLWYLYNRKK
ncbi:MAG TPA: hypothetical protein VK191_12155 [Symbiobacteriaceae bacterium]|nr:hypothetical protein [Symbiobacteriaceae bacterium]